MNYLAIAVAGFLGAVFRKFLGDLLIFNTTQAFPVNTLIINVSGCFALSFFMSLTSNRFRIPPSLRLAVGTGFLGAYTTFSTFSYETISLFGNSHILFGFLYVVLTTAGCIISAWGGLAAGRMFENRCRDEGEKVR